MHPILNLKTEGTDTQNYETLKQGLTNSNNNKKFIYMFIGVFIKKIKKGNT